MPSNPPKQAVSPGLFVYDSTMKSHRNTKIGRKVVRATADIPHQFHGHKIKVVKVTRPVNAVTANQPYLQNGKAYEHQTWYMDGVRWLA